MSIRIIGITGPTGAGKSSLSQILSQNGVPVIDADQVYHSMLVPPSPCLDALCAVFGKGILKENGELDRPALSALVFEDPEKLKLLNQTVLGIVIEEVRHMLRALEEEGQAVVAIDAPTLIESGFHRECDSVVSVLAPRELRLARIMERDGITKEAAQARVDAQKDDRFYTDHSTYSVVNGDSREEFLKSCMELLPRLILSASSSGTTK